MSAMDASKDTNLINDDVVSASESMEHAADGFLGVAPLGSCEALAPLGKTQVAQGYSTSQGVCYSESVFYSPSNFSALHTTVVDAMRPTLTTSAAVMGRRVSSDTCPLHA